MSDPRGNTDDRVCERTYYRYEFALDTCSAHIRSYVDAIDTSLTSVENQSEEMI